MSEWVEWKGGECPVGADVMVQCRLEQSGAGWDMEIKAARDWSWQHYGHCVPGNIIAYRIVEPEPEKKLGRQYVRYVSDAAWEAFKAVGDDDEDREAVEDDCAEMGIVMLTVAEHDELLTRGAYDEASVRGIEAERDALRAEVERLRAMVSEMCRMDFERFCEIERLRKGVMLNETGPAPSSAREHAVAGDASAKTREHPNLYIDPEVRAKLTAEELELIYRRFDEFERLRKGRDDGQMAQEMASDNRGASVAARTAIRMVADTLDHRLGLGLPDGEPVEPMSARSWKRGM